MRILVTNDDGIDSEGIHALVRALAATPHEIMVVAPASNWSGAGAALGSGLGDLDPAQPLDVRRVEIPGAPEVPAWALAGPPALTVVAAHLGAFGIRPDIVVSGINAGCNTGRSVLHSGTVGAVLTGQNFGISGLAVSVDSSDSWQWESAATVAVEVLDLVIAAPPRSAINLNVPALPRNEIRGVRWARLAPFGSVRAAVRSASDHHLEFVLEPSGYEPPSNTDQGCVQAGYASLTTLVGIAEAWPEPGPAVDAGADSAGLVPHLAPGAPLHEVHVVPDASEHRLLRRPGASS